MAIRMASSVKCPLAAIILGSLYAWLDHVAVDSTLRIGRFGVSNYANYVLLTSFLFAQFPDYAPAGNYPSSQLVRVPQICCWNHKSVNKPVIDLIDIIEKFSPLVYVGLYQFFTNEFFAEEERPIVPLEEALARNFPSNNFPPLLIPSYLLSYTEWSSFYSVYSPPI